MHTHTYVQNYIQYTHTSNFPVLNRKHAGHIEWGQQHRVCWSCVSELEVVLISSGVDVFLGAEKLNSSSAEQETDNTPITTPLNIGVAGGPAGPSTCLLYTSDAADE